jgi:NADH-quinone oxidoreductase subunit N
MSDNLSQSIQLAIPMLVQFVGGMGLMMMEAVVRPANKSVYRPISLGLILLSTVLTLGMMGLVHEPVVAFNGMLRMDAYGMAFGMIALLGGAASVAVSHEYLEKIEVRVGEYYALIHFALLGMMLMAFATDMMMVFISLEVMSISMYILCGIRRSDQRSVESAFKYFILGAFTSAIQLYGIAMLYGATGGTSLEGIAQALSGELNPLLLVGMALLFSALGFKVGNAPFHMWLPDVYQGAPTSVLPLLTTGVKISTYAAIGRFIIMALGDNGVWWTTALWIIAALTMLIGNLGALVQQDLKRVLAYSSIAHGGYLMMALSIDPNGMTDSKTMGSILFYSLTYTFISATTLGVLTLMVRDGSAGDTDVSRLAGLGHTRPWLAAGLSMCLVSLAGIPPSMGFIGKFYLFASVLEAGYPGLAVVGAIGASMGVYYYLRPIVYMYMHDGHPDLHRSPWVNGMVVVTCVLTVVLGLVPGPVLAWAEEAVRSVLG